MSQVGTPPAVEGGWDPAGAAGCFLWWDLRTRTLGLQDGPDAEGYQSCKGCTVSRGPAAATLGVPDPFSEVGE